MSLRAPYKAWAQDSSGDVIGGAAVEVRTQVGNSLATLYAGRTGAATLTNPFNAESDGSFEFWAGTGPYTLTVGAGASATSKPIVLDAPNYSGAVFNVLDYIAAQPNGDAEISKIIGGDFGTQDGDVVTAGVQAAFVAWYESGVSGNIYFPPGYYLVNDEITAGTTSSGKTVAKHIKDGDLGGSEIPIKTLGVKGEYKQSWLVVDEAFRSTDSNFLDSVVVRYENPSKRIHAPAIEGLSFWAEISRANRSKCPTAIKIDRGNFAKVTDLVIRGLEYEWPACGVHIENVNNSFFQNWRVKAGYQPTIADMWNSSSGGGSFDVTMSGSRIVSNDTSSPFANPAGESDSFWNDKYLLLGQGNWGAYPEHVVVKTASSGAKVNNNTIDLDASWTAPADDANINISFEMVYGGMTANDNTMSLVSPVLTSDDEGRLVHFLRVGWDIDDERGVLSAYIKPGSISADGKSCALVAGDGTTVANAGVTKTRQHVVFSPGIYVGQSYGNAEGHNNDCVFSAIHSEKNRGGAQFLLEKILGSHFMGGKAHGRAGSDSSPMQQFTESGYLMVLDNCKNVEFSDFLFTWFQGLDGNAGYASGIRVFGARNNISISKYEFYGSSDRVRLFRSSGVGADQRFIFGSGLNNINNWGASGSDMDLFEIGGYWHQLVVEGDMKLRDTGGSNGHTDQLAVYRRSDFGDPQRTTISSGAITIVGGYVSVDTEGGAASDDLDTINGGRDGQMLLLQTQDSSRDVVVKHATGNIQTPDGADITLTRARRILQLVYTNGFWRVIQGG